MKKIFFYAALFVATNMFTACEEEKIISANELPAISRTFIETHFPDVEPTTIVWDRGGLDKVSLLCCLKICRSMLPALFQIFELSKSTRNVMATKSVFPAIWI
ncbi:MAG: hypothetical protein LBF17_01775 [Mediterranea sp.]|jgi:hypothetical protein|nr:hypothetical protein [Mediterranea sp.]